MGTCTRRAAAATALAVATATFTLVTTPAEAHTTGIHDNCTKLHQKWPHGVGRKGARDRGGNVTNFYRNTRQYNLAERHNGTLDGDNDGIACEKK